MTDITELAQSLKAAATNVKETAHIARYLKATIARQTFKELMTPDNILALVEALEKSEKASEARREAIDRTFNMFVRERDRANAAEEALEKARQVDEELCRLLPPGAEYMDPPDGGDVTPLEVVRRMVADYRQRIAELREWNAGLAQESFERQQRISELLEGKVGNALLERENHHVEVVGKLAERIAELEESHAQVIQSRDHYKRITEEGLRRLAESRTVKLPALPRLGANTEWYQGFAAGAESMRSDCAHAINAAGIKVEAE